MSDQNNNNDQQNLSPTLFSLKKSWDSAKNFSLSRIGGLFKNKQKKLKNVTIDKIKLWLENPQKYQNEILDLSDNLYAPEGIYKVLVNLTTNMATLDNYLQPDFYTMQKLKEEINNQTSKEMSEEKSQEIGRAHV